MLSCEVVPGLFMPVFPGPCRCRRQYPDSRIAERYGLRSVIPDRHAELLPDKPLCRFLGDKCEQGGAVAFDLFPKVVAEIGIRGKLVIVSELELGKIGQSQAMVHDFAILPGFKTPVGKAGLVQDVPKPVSRSGVILSEAGRPVARGRTAEHGDKTRLQDIFEDRFHPDCSISHDGPIVPYTQGFIPKRGCRPDERTGSGPGHGRVYSCFQMQIRFT